MRTLLKYCLIVLVSLLPAISYAADPFPAQQTFAGQTLTLNGKGTRTKAVFHLYDAGLYLPAKNQDAKAILSIEQPMAMRLVITSGMITSENMTEAVRDGFKQAGASAALQPRIDQLINVFKSKIQKGDVYDFIYTPTSITIIKNGANAATIAGSDFKQTFLGIWLGDHPVQESLKKALLGA